MTWTELYGGAAEDVKEELLSGPLVLSGLPGSGRGPLIRELMPTAPLIEVCPRQAGTLAGLKLDLLNQLLNAFATFPEASTARDFRHFVAASFGARGRDVLDAAESRDASDLSIAEILGGVPGHACVMVHDAHLLPAISDRALWALRARAQEGDPPRVVLLTRNWHRADLVGPDAAFFGFGQAFDLPVPGLADWHRVGPADDELAWLLSQTRGLPRPTLATLDRLKEGVGLHEAWRSQVNDSARVAEEVRRLAYAIHAYAPRLLAAVAAGERVYRSVPAARTDTVASVLRLMREHDLIYQPRPRQWVLADPALEPHLAARPI